MMFRLISYMFQLIHLLTLCFLNIQYSLCFVFDIICRFLENALTDFAQNFTNE